MTYNKSLFKWAGGKGKALKHILPILEKHKCKTLVEPFIGAANISLNFDTDNYVWNDINQYLSNTYKLLLKGNEAQVDNYIEDCSNLFKRGYGDYYQIRDMFNNKQTSLYEKLVIFQYLNKMCFNGLFRTNKSGVFNVPVGTIKKNIPSVPIENIKLLSSRHGGNTKILCGDYESVFKRAKLSSDCLIYCDSPYAPLTTEFKYDAKSFNKEDHIKLKELAKESKHTTVLSNHWTDFTKDLYKDADELYTFEVQRTISCKGGGRKKVEEVVAVYLGEN
jgi:DNA adenine methylase